MLLVGLNASRVALASFKPFVLGRHYFVRHRPRGVYPRARQALEGRSLIDALWVGGLMPRTLAIIRTR